MSLQFLPRYHDLKHLQAIEVKDGYCRRKMEGELERVEKSSEPWVELEEGGIGWLIAIAAKPAGIYRFPQAIVHGICKAILAGP